MLLSDNTKQIEEIMGNPERPEAWQRVLDKVTEKYENHIIGDVIKARYLKGQRVARTCIELDISERLYFKYRAVILNAFAAGLIQEGVLKFYE